MTQINKDEVKIKEAAIRNSLKNQSIKKTPMVKRCDDESLINEELRADPIYPILDNVTVDFNFNKLATKLSEIEGCSKPIETKFINQSTFEFTDISSEQYRIYEFSNGKTVMISEPLKLSVSKSGGHRIFDNSGISHYIPQGWIHISWRAKDGQPNFVK